jgi:protein-L-isoaspartate(D-aspartate) O-methyltransferase
MQAVQSQSLNLSRLSTPKLFGKLFNPAIDENASKAIIGELIKRYENNEVEAISLLDLLGRIHDSQGMIPQFDLKNLRQQIPEFPKKTFETITSVPRNEFFPSFVKASLLEIPAEKREKIEKSNLIIVAKPGVTLSEPILISQMALLLDIKENDKILDVGSGLGYHAAILAKLAPLGRVYGVERDLEVAKSSRRTLRRIGIQNVKIYHSDGKFGLKEKGPFDKINVACLCRGFPEDLLAQLKIGGRMIMPVEQYIQAGKTKVRSELLYLVQKTSESDFEKQALWTVFFVPMQEGIGY